MKKIFLFTVSLSLLFGVGGSECMHRVKALKMHTNRDRRAKDDRLKAKGSGSNRAFTVPRKRGNPPMKREAALVAGPKTEVVPEFVPMIATNNHCLIRRTPRPLMTYALVTCLLLSLTLPDQVSALGKCTICRGSVCKDCREIDPDGTTFGVITGGTVTYMNEEEKAEFDRDMEELRREREKAREERAMAREQRQKDREERASEREERARERELRQAREKHDRKQPSDQRQAKPKVQGLKVSDINWGDTPVNEETVRKQKEIEKLPKGKIRAIGVEGQHGEELLDEHGNL